MVREVSFVCDGGVSFNVSYLNAQVRVTTKTESYILDRRPSSIGNKFSSDRVTFIHDEDRAALVGAGGGPFRLCREDVDAQRS